MTEPFVRADVRAFLDLMAANPRPRMTAEALPAMRALASQGTAMLDVPVGEIATITDHVVPGPAGDIPARLFDARERREPGPVVLFCHGGGFVIGNIETHAAICAEMARVLDLPVLSIDYRLAPEHPWPAAPDDCEAAARWIAENGAAFGRGFTSLVLSGDSAGGNLAIVTALALRDRPAALPVILQFPIYPAADPLGRYPSAEAFGAGYQLDAEDMRLFNQLYRPRPRDWRAAPLHADQSRMPATLILAAALDPLRDQARAYAAATISAGVPTTYRECAGTIHGFLSYRRMIPSAQGDFAGALAAARAMIAEAEGERVMAQAAKSPEFA